MDVQELEQDVVLAISGEDVYEAHTALRHVEEINKGNHSILVMLPYALRKHAGFTPWLKHAETRSRDMKMVSDSGKVQSVCELQFSAKTQHVHSHRSSHYASFDARIAGKSVRTLFDTGATCSCVSLGFATRVGLSWKNTKRIESIGGVGGDVVILGRVSLSVKIGGHHCDHDFLVVEKAIANYDCLLGEDFFVKNSCGIFYTEFTVNVRVGCNSKGLGKVVVSRRLANSIPTEIRSGFAAAVLAVRESNVTPHLASKNQTKRLLREIRAGKAVGYRVIISPTQIIAAVDDDPVPAGIQAVIDKHSKPEGTLCGKIPPNTHAKGYACHIELAPGAKPVHIRQYRLTPLEREELLRQVDAFIEKGWIELSASSWCSSVLFVPKPNNKLRFCVDFRAVNARTVPDRGPIPNQSELLDQAQGATLFSALDLASGYYQLAMAPDSKEFTAFPTPYGLCHWKVMPMGLSNAPAIFQQAMNQILREHIVAGYCMVYLDDIIIMSKNNHEHAKQVDAVLTSLHEHNLFCQLPKCFWAKKELKYLGHLVSGTGVKPDPAKVATLDQWAPPMKHIETLTQHDVSAATLACAKKQIVHECRRFLGFMNYFHRFIPQFAAVAEKMYEQTQNDAGQ